MEAKHDQALLQILKEERNVTNFLDAFFGFMYRCTDFYVHSTPDQKLGFPPGVADNLVLTILQKWKRKWETEEVARSTARLQVVQLPEPIQEVEVSTEGNQLKAEPAKVSEAPIRPVECYNGAITDNYTWSQTIKDLDFQINIPPYIQKAKDLQVDISANRIRIDARTEIIKENNELEKYSQSSSSPEWTVIFDAELNYKIHRDDSIWSIIPGRYVDVHVEKFIERWWDALTKGEPKIDLSKMDCSILIDDLAVNEQMKVHELMWNHQQKLLGKPTSDQINLEKVLKKAWNVEGSPFKGSEYDPSVLHFNEF
ncbi:nudC domain-containing protein 3 [Athalia rosae]|uniref:nudC domain-containing protein 3 n=1 Tax=Athalia rosae TaxID=37344 RepID=UPI002033BBFC|nr:nudC domain-containing protein 3 [Athalia rosae]